VVRLVLAGVQGKKTQARQRVSVTQSTHDYPSNYQLVAEAFLLLPWEAGQRAANYAILFADSLFGGLQGTVSAPMPGEEEALQLRRATHSCTFLRVGAMLRLRLARGSSRELKKATSPLQRRLFSSNFLHCPLDLVFSYHYRTTLFPTFIHFPFFSPVRSATRSFAFLPLGPLHNSSHPHVIFFPRRQQTKETCKFRLCRRDFKNQPSHL
jgi:hypothetical protein